MKLIKFTQSGFAHWIMPVVVIGLIAATGGYMYLNQSHAQTPPAGGGSSPSVYFGAKDFKLSGDAIVYTKGWGGPSILIGLGGGGITYNSGTSFNNLVSFVRLHRGQSVHFCAAAALNGSPSSVSADLVNMTSTPWGVVFGATTQSVSNTCVKVKLTSKWVNATTNIPKIRIYTGIHSPRMFIYQLWLTTN